MEIWKKVFAVLIFVLVWLGMIKEEYKFVKLGRTMSTTMGAAAMLMFQILDEHSGFLAISLDTLTLLTGCMLISAYADDAGCFSLLQNALATSGVPHPPKNNSEAELNRYRIEFHKYNEQVADKFFSPEILFLVKMCCITSIIAAIMTNDTACVLLAPIVSRAAYSRGFKPGPYLIGLATSANIGASLTPVGSPQAMIIADLSGISFGKFLVTQILSVVMVWLINIITIICFNLKEFFPSLRFRQLGQPLVRPFRKELFSVHDSKNIPKAVSTPPPVPCPCVQLRSSFALPSSHSFEAVQQQEIPPIASSTHDEAGGIIPEAIVSNFSVELSSSSETSNQSEKSLSQILAFPQEHETTTPIPAALAQEDLEAIRRRISYSIPAMEAIVENRVVAEDCTPSSLSESSVSRPIQGWRSICIHALLVAFPVCLALYEKPGMGWVSVAIASLMAAVDGSSPHCRLVRVDGFLLLFFASLFVVMAGLNATGFPKQLWEVLESSIDVKSGSGVALFSVFIIVFSNIISNVPLCIMLGPLITSSASFKTPDDEIGKNDYVARAWMILQFVSTVGGNLTLVGSVANLIVVKCSSQYYDLGFLEYTKVGFVSTVIGTVIGTALVWVSCTYFANF